MVEARQKTIEENLGKNYVSCPFCGKKHIFSSIQDLASQFGVSTDTIRRLVSEVPHIKLGRRRVVPECSIKLIINQQLPEDLI